MKKLLIAIALALASCSPPREHESLSLAAQPMSQDSTGFRFVIIEARVFNTFAWLYKHWDETEWMLCLYGPQRGDSLFISTAPLARMQRATVDEVVGTCDQNSYLRGDAHSHGPKSSDKPDRCYFSVIDDGSWSRSKNVIDIVVCSDTTALMRVHGDSTKYKLKFPKAG